MIFIGFGANLNGKYGSPEETFQKIAAQFSHHEINIISPSSIWESAPVPVSDQPWYKNAVCAVETQLSPHELLRVLNTLEHDAGRVRTIQNAPRVLDLDLLAYNKIILNDDELNLPHPQMHNRAFVLYPLNEIAPDWVHPTSGMNVDKMMSNLPKGQEIKRITGSNIDPVRMDNSKGEH